MDTDQIQAYLALLAAAEVIGEEIYNGVVHVLRRSLTKDELEAVLAQWDENKQRAAANAGIVP